MINAMDDWLSLDKIYLSDVSAFEDAIQSYKQCLRLVNTFDGKYTDMYIKLQEYGALINRTQDGDISSVIPRDVTDQVRRNRALAEIKRFTHQVQSLYGRFMDSLVEAKLVRKITMDVITTNNFEPVVVTTYEAAVSWLVSNYTRNNNPNYNGYVELKYIDDDDVSRDRGTYTTCFRDESEPRYKNLLIFPKVSAINDSTTKVWSFNRLQTGNWNPRNFKTVFYIASDDYDPQDTDFLNALSGIYIIVAVNGLQKRNISLRSAALLDPTYNNKGRLVYRDTTWVDNQPIQAGDLITVRVWVTSSSPALSREILGKLAVGVTCSYNSSSEVVSQYLPYQNIVSSGTRTEEHVEEVPQSLEVLFAHMRDQMSGFNEWASGLLDVDDPVPSIN